MKLEGVHEDIEYANSIVPAGYLLVFIGYDTGEVGGNIVKRYKDHAGLFGTLAGSTLTQPPADDDITDEDASVLIQESLVVINSNVEEILELRSSGIAISNQLDEIIGE
jgi:hypothetical protein